MSTSFIPFGSQYYRAPTPLSEEWEADLQAFRAHGFNTVKLWAQWRWNNPREDSYSFADLDRLMDLCAELELKVMINAIFDVAPAWFYKKYPDSLMITSDGRKVEPQSTAWRQIGGAPGPCYNHAAARQAKHDFLAQVVSRYKDHPALYIWDLWNEPELTCGIYRRPVQSDMVCYCDTCVEAFKQWLQGRYRTIAALNRRWHRNYADWDEIEAPRNSGTFNDMIDWRMYFSSVLTEELRQRVETTKSIDPRTPVMVHTVPMPNFNIVNAGSNDYELAELCDMFGNSVGNHPFPAALSMSCAQGKTVLNAEIHALGGDTYGRPIIPTFNHMKSFILTPLARGVKGFVFWQYRPERLGRESPAWGLTALDGSPTEWLAYGSQISAVLQQHAELINAVQPMRSDIAIVNSNRNQAFDWCVSGSVDLHSHSVIGAYMAMYDGNRNADVIGLEQFSESFLAQYRVIYYPFPYYMDGKTASLLKEWVRNGGCLISEAFFAAYEEDTGLHASAIPGYGFVEVFGCREGTAVSASMFNNAYDKQWYSEADNKFVAIQVETDGISGILSDGEAVEGYYFAEELVVTESAGVLGRFADGKAAVTEHRYGRGKAIWIGSLLGYAYHTGGSAKLREWMCGLIDRAGMNQRIKVEGGQVRADILVHEGTDKAILVVASREGKDAAVTITFSASLLGSCSYIQDLFTERKLPVRSVAGAFEIKLDIAAHAHELFRFGA